MRYWIVIATTNIIGLAMIVLGILMYMKVD